MSLSPDGKWMAYAVTIPDVEENKSRSATAGSSPPGRRRAAAPDRRAIPRTPRRLSRPTGARSRSSRTARGSPADLDARSLGRGAAPARPPSSTTSARSVGRPTASGSSSRPTSSPTAPTRRARRGGSKDRGRVEDQGAHGRAAALPALGLLEGRPAHHIWRCRSAEAAASDLTPGDRDAPAFGRRQRLRRLAGRQGARSSRRIPDTVEALSTNVGRLGALLRRLGRAAST